MKIIKTAFFIDKKGYKCPSKKCKRKYLYCWVFSYTNYQAINFGQMAESTYNEFKNVLIDFISETPSRIEKIGGGNTRIQIDITAICNGLVIDNPSKHETLLEKFKKYILPGTIIVSDGYSSYPKAVANFGSVHELVNHSKGFVNGEGGHTNQIENFWSNLDHDYRKRSELNYNLSLNF
ncbi:DDE-TNP-IS1595 domain-containing protein [Vairimorpha necatrix]|uniref:DDE-TNP-IS1595 domain-containing protein n=1 Tax=Vairimorpha necatrix TaxID=6039 RepID=A0AAX4JEX8_9MICR